MIAMLVEDLDLSRRRPVWEAISDLWRDTELQEYEADYIAKVLAQSRYSIKELHEIYAFEVAPVVWANFLSAVPSVWAGFDIEWLTKEIINNIERQRKSKAYRCYVRNKVGVRMRTWVVKGDWGKVLKVLESKYAAARAV